MKRILPLVAFVLCASGAAAKPTAELPVTAGRQYELSFRARVAKGPTLEDHPEYAELVPLAVSRPTIGGIRFAAVNWAFLSDRGTRIVRPHDGGQPVTLFSGQWRRIVARIWIPDGAVAVRVSPVPGDGSQRIGLADVAVRELPDDGVLFSTPSLDDPDVPSGWQLVGAAQYLTDAEGRGCISLGEGHANGLAFPVVPGSRLEVKLRGRYSPLTRRPNLNCWMWYARDYAAMQRKSGFKQSVFPLSIAKGESSGIREFDVPEGMNWARISVYNGEFQGVEVRRVDRR